MSAVKNFEDLKCWQAARELTRLIYQVSGQDPLAKDWDLRAQIRRASVSAMSNIAEGFGRRSEKEFVRFLEMSQSSVQEVKSLTFVIEDQSYLPGNVVNDMRDAAEKTKGLTLGLIRYLRNKRSC